MNTRLIPRCDACLEKRHQKCEGHFLWCECICPALTSPQPQES